MFNQRNPDNLSKYPLDKISSIHQFHLKVKKSAPSIDATQINI